MRRVKVTTALFALLFLPACEGPAPAEPSFEPAFNRADEVRVIAQAMGTYRIQPGVAPIDVTFNALKKGDGRVMGEAEFVLLTGNIISEVVCLTVIDNVAWIGLRHVGGTHSAVAGGISHGWIRVENNGQGRSAPTDRASAIAAFQTEQNALAYCAIAPNAPAFNPLLSGNIQVRER
jgi:hypothetical protein